MAQPLPENQPLLDVLAQNKTTVAEMNTILKDGADEAERLIPKLIEKHTTGSTVKAAQLALVLRELKVAQSALWGDLGASTRQGVTGAYDKAAEGASDVLLRVFGRNGVDASVWRNSWREQAKQGLAAVLAKSKNGIPLSRAVYKTQALATGLVDRRIKQGLLLGMNAKAIAKSVKDLINPSVKGGVSYAAHRLARTEINHAYQTAQHDRHQDSPWTKGMQWNLSGSHPAPDICNVNATQNLYGMGAGVYPFGKKPDSHPNCLCYQTVVQASEEEFIDAFVNGDYNSWLDEQAYLHAPPEDLLCP